MENETDVVGPVQEQFEEDAAEEVHGYGAFEGGAEEGVGAVD